MNFVEAIREAQLRSELLQDISDLDKSLKTESGLPVYDIEWYDSNSHVYPMIVDTNIIDRSESSLINSVMIGERLEVLSIYIPLDEDPFRYWSGKLVYLTDYSGEYIINYVYIVKNVELSYDEEFYDIEDYVVDVVPYISLTKLKDLITESSRVTSGELLKNWMPVNGY